MSAVDLIARIETTATTHARVVDLLRAYADVVRAEPGNLRFELYDVANDDGASVIVVIERYADDDAFRAHLAHPANAQLNAVLEQLLEAGGSQLEFLSPLITGN